MNKTYSEVNTVGLKVKAVKGAGINVATQFVGLICHTVGVIVLARLLTPKDFGLVAMVTAFSYWFMNFGVNGFTEYIIQKQHISKKDVNSIFWLHVFLATFLASGFACFGFLLVDFYEEPALIGISAAMATSFILHSFFTTHFALLMREMKFASIAIVQLVAVILSIVFAIAVAIGGMGYWAVVTRQLTIPAVSIIAAWFICPWRPGRPRHIANALPGLKYAIQVYCNFSLGYVTKNIDKVLLGKLHGSELLGNYDRAIHLSSMPANQLLAPLHSVALATLSRLKNDKERFAAYYTKAVSTITFLGTILAVILTLSAQDLIPLLLGPEWVEAGKVVMALGPGIAAMFVYGTHSWLHLSLGTPNRWLRWNIFASILTITAFIIAAPFGAVAMGIAYSARAYFLVVPALWYAGRPIQLGLKGILSSVWPYFTAAILVSLLWFYLSSRWPPLSGLLEKNGPFNRVVMITFFVSFFYVAFVILVQRSFSSIREIIAFIRLLIS